MYTLNVHYTWSIYGCCAFIIYKNNPPPKNKIKQRVLDPPLRVTTVLKKCILHSITFKWYLYVSMLIDSKCWATDPCRTAKVFLSIFFHKWCKTCTIWKNHLDPLPGLWIFCENIRINRIVFPYKNLVKLLVQIEVASLWKWWQSWWMSLTSSRFLSVNFLFLWSKCTFRAYIVWIRPSYYT